MDTVGVNEEMIRASLTKCSMSANLGEYCNNGRTTVDSHQKVVVGHFGSTYRNIVVRQCQADRSIYLENILFINS